MSAKPLRLVIVGGPNGCGKTTFAREYAEGEGLNYLGADDIAARLRPDDPYAARIDAGRAFSRELAAALESGLSLVIESTLAGGSLTRYLAQARERGYRVTLVFVFLESPDLCLERIAERVAQGGHDVPEADVRRRYARASRRFWNTYRDLADDWVLIDNGGDSFRQVASGIAEAATVYDEENWRRFQEAVLSGENDDVEAGK